MSAEIIVADVRDGLAALPEQSVQCVVTSPPYWALRDYGVDGQIGQEPTPDEYVATIVDVFRGVWRVLSDDGVVFLNLGDSYYGSGKGRNADGSFHEGSLNGKQGTNRGSVEGRLFKTGVRAAGVHEYGTSDTTGSDCPDRDSSSRSHGDGRTDALLNRTTGSGCHPALAPVAELCSRTQVCMATLLDHLPIGDCSDQQPSTRSLVAIRDLVRTASHEAELALASLESMPTESWQQHQGDSRLSGSLSAYQSSLRSFVAGARAFDHMSDGALETPDCMAGIASLCEVLAHHIRCTVECCSLLSSWLNTPYIQPKCTTLKPKNLIGIPWRVAFALQTDGWYLRSDIIWAKPNPMPESVTDRPTRAHEYVFLLAKKPRYYYDADAIRTPPRGDYAPGLHSPYAPPGQAPHRGYRHESNGKHADKQRGHSRRHEGFNDRWDAMSRDEQQERGANKRTVWTIATRPFPDAHFATFPESLVEPCVLAGSREGDTVLDPFAGSGTVGVVALRHNRRFVGIELNHEYAEMARRRITGDAPLLNEAVLIEGAA